jgi:hypothetical protein
MGGDSRKSGPESDRGILASLDVVVQILQVSGGDLGSGAEIQGIRVKIGEGQWRRSQRTLREEDDDKPQPKPRFHF